MLELDTGDRLLFYTDANGPPARHRCLADLALNAMDVDLFAMADICSMTWTGTGTNRSRMTGH